MDVIPIAAYRVLNTNELLEEILMHLPTDDLLKSIRFVSKGWQSLVSNSPKLQWKTWQWKGTTIPPSVLEDRNPRSDCGYGERFGCEFAVDTLYWLRKFWCMVLNHSRESDGEDGLSPEYREWAIRQIPDMELFRPRREGAPRLVFDLILMFSNQSLAFPLITGELIEIDITEDQLTLRGIARLIFERALSSEAMEVFKYLLQRQEGSSPSAEATEKVHELTFIIETESPENLSEGRPVPFSVDITFVFKPQDLDPSSPRIPEAMVEYQQPSKSSTAVYKPSTMFYNLGRRSWEFS